MKTILHFAAFCQSDYNTRQPKFKVSREMKFLLHFHRF